MIDVYYTTLQLNNVTVDASQQVRVLEVHLSSDLSLDKHVSSVNATCFHHLRAANSSYPALVRRWFGSDTRACLRNVARRLLQCSPRRGSQVNQRQATTSVECCRPSRQWHQEVRPWTLATDAPGVTLAGHPWVSQLQVGHADSPVSARQSASVSVQLLYPGRPSLNTSSSTLCYTSSADRSTTLLTLTVVAVAGPMTFNTLPNDLRDPSVSTATFGQLLKIHLFSAYQHV